MSDHNPIYHLKDAYFFEVPKPLWQHNWQSLEDVPEFLRRPYEESGHMPTVEEFNTAMEGKVLIPQPFADLDSLYSVRSGFGISKYMILEVVLAAILFYVFSKLAKQLSSGAPAKGKVANLFEMFIMFIRDEVARRLIPTMTTGMVTMATTITDMAITVTGTTAGLPPSTCTRATALSPCC
jgi:hypothetical protein